MAFLGAFIVFYIIIMIIVLAACIGFYILGAIGTYNIAKNRGYDKAYLAFIPVANGYLLGAITDNINQCYGKKTNYRMWLLISYSVYTVAYVFNLVNTFNIFDTMYNSSYYPYSYSSPNPITFPALMTTLMSMIASLGMFGAIIVRSMALYKIYSDYSQKNAVLFTVFSIIFNLYPIFLFVIRKNPSASTYYAYQARYGQQQQQYNQHQHYYQQQNNQPPSSDDNYR